MATIAVPVSPRTAAPTAPAPAEGWRARVAVVGLGYVGLPTALALSAGADVTGIDSSPHRLRAIADGEVDLPASVCQQIAVARASGKLMTTSSTSALATVDVVIICVPTPVDEHLVPDLAPLRAACADVVAAIAPGTTVILTSTCHVGATAELLVAPLRERGFIVGDDVFVAFSPERINPGVDGPTLVPRVVGGVTAACGERAAAVLAAAGPVHRVSSAEAAELTKLHENTFRAVNIAYVNELAEAASAYGLDIAEVVGAAATKPYGFMPFLPGPGVGGHCIPCDPHYLLWDLRRRRQEAPLIETAMTRIARRPSFVVQRVVNELAAHGLSIVGADVLVCGVTYKPGVEDVREAPALEVIDRLAAAGARVAFTDSRVTSLRGHDGSVRQAYDNAPSGRWDAVVVIHSDALGVDRAWLGEAAVVVDATYQLAAPGNVVRL